MSKKMTIGHESVALDLMGEIAGILAKLPDNWYVVEYAFEEYQAPNKITRRVKIKFPNQGILYLELLSNAADLA